MLTELVWDHGLTHHIGIQKDGPAVRPLTAAAMEHLMIIDREGKVRLVIDREGMPRRPDLVKTVEDLLEKLLGQAGSGSG